LRRQKDVDVVWHNHVRVDFEEIRAFSIEDGLNQGFCDIGFAEVSWAEAGGVEIGFESLEFFAWRRESFVAKSIERSAWEGAIKAPCQEEVSIGRLPMR
jgi:hypothetical protein